MSFRYRIAGWQLDSDLPFAALAPMSGADAETSRIALSTRARPFEEPARWLYNERYEDTDVLWRAVGVRGDRYLVRLFGFADFLLEKGRHEAEVHVAEGADPRAIEPLFLEQVMPLWWSLLGRPCLHASAVVRGDGARGRAIAFAGVSGSGKSTLAASLAGAGGLIADDCLVVEPRDGRVIVHPGHRAVRLFGDSAQAFFASAEAGEPSPDGGKRRVEVPAADREHPLARVYLLAPGAATARVTPLRPRDALSRLLGCFFRIDPEDRSRLAGELDLLDRIAAGTVVAQLDVPRRFDALGEVHAAVAADLARDAGAAP